MIVATQTTVEFLSLILTGRQDVVAATMVVEAHMVEDGTSNVTLLIVIQMVVVAEEITLSAITPEAADMVTIATEDVVITETMDITSTQKPSIASHVSNGQ